MIFAANWKMNGNIKFLNSILAEIKQDIIPYLADNSKIIVCPPSVYLSQAKLFCHNTSIEIGAQDCSSQENGAFTGEISADMLSDVGSQWVILGHSERRQYHSENNDLLHKKMLLAKLAGLKVILCIGETHDQHANNKTKDILAEQLSIICGSDLNNLEYIIAYEPIWAIGTGLIPKLEEINEIHQFIKSFLFEKTSLKSKVQVLYGGSVNPENARQIKSLITVDGVLVGGASLSAEKFKQICI